MPNPTGAPSDWQGAEALEVMLADLTFPATTEELLARAGAWRVPVRGGEASVPLAELLADVPRSRRFRSATEVARAAARGEGEG